MADGKVEYEVRADLSKLDGDLSQAQAKVVKSAEQTADKQEKAENKSVKAVKDGEKDKVEAVEKANGKVENSTNETEKKRTNIVSKAAQKIKNHIKEAAQKSSEEIDKQSQNSEKAIGGANDKIIASVGKAVAAIGGISAAIAGVKSAIGSVVGLDKGTNQIAAALGLTAEEAEKYKSTIKEIYADNFGESFEDISHTIALLKQQMKGLGDDELKGATEAAYMLADVYDIDIAEGIRGANSLVNKFGISAEEAYNLMAQGAEKGLNQNGDLADQIAEYATYYSQLGFSAQDAFNMMQTAAENGVYQIDKINDAMKEFGIRSIDGSETTAKGFQALGLDAEKLGKAFSDGGETAKEAFNIVINALADMDDSVAQDAAGVALFGTQWEDLGADAVLSLANVNSEIDTTRDKLTEIGEIKYDDLGSMLETLKRKFELMLQPLGEQLIPIIIEAVEELTPVVESIIPSLIDFLPVVTGIIKALLPIISDVLKFIVQFKDILAPLAIGLGAAKLAMNAFTLACNANPIMIAVGAVAALVAGIASLISTANSCTAEVEALRTSHEQLQQSIDNSLATQEAENAMLRDKADRYEDLRTQANLTAAEEAELKDLADELQQKLGNNCEVVNSLTHEYNDLTGAVEQYITAQNAKVKLQAYENAATQAYQDDLKLKQEKKKIEEQLAYVGNPFDARTVLDANNENYWGAAVVTYSLVKRQQLQNSLASIEEQQADNQAIRDQYDQLYSEGFKTNTPDLSAMSDSERVTYYRNLSQKNNGSGTTTSGGGDTKPDYTYTAPTTSGTGTSSSSTSSSSAASTAKSSGATASSGNSGNTINITSFIPTVWDSAEAANAKLKAGGVAASLVGNSKSGKLIEGLSSTSAAKTATAQDLADATLNDVVSAIKDLKITQEKMQYTLDVTLKTDNYTLAKATVKGINAITKATGKSPLTTT